MSRRSKMRVAVDRLDVFVVDEDGKTKHRAGAFELSEEGEPLFDVEGNNWTFSADELREIADTQDRFRDFIGAWRRSEEKQAVPPEPPPPPPPRDGRGYQPVRRDREVDVPRPPDE